MQPFSQTQLNTYGLNKPQLISLIAAFIICLWALVAGIQSGLARERSRLTLSGSQSIISALGYYYSDQEVFPTADHFYNRNILVPFYLSAMPIHASVKGGCHDFAGYQYSRPNPKSFSLKYCLESGVEGRDAGIHEFTERDLR